MKLLLPIFIFLSLASNVSARQEIFPPAAITEATDSFYIVLHNQQQAKQHTLQINTIADFNNFIKELQVPFPLYTGMVKLHLAYYSDSLPAAEFFKQAIPLLTSGGQKLASNFASSFFWLQEGFYLDKRNAEWAPIDRLYRNSIVVATGNNNLRYAITNYANELINNEKYTDALPLLEYDLLYFDNLAERSYYDNMTIAFIHWLKLKLHLQQWVEIPYEHRSEAQFSFNGRVVPKFFTEKENYKSLREYPYEKSFTKVFKLLDNLKKEAIETNKRSHKNYDKDKRSSYFYLYTEIMQAFYTWTQNDYKQSKYLLPAKIFLVQDLGANELKDAEEHKVYPLISAPKLSKLYTNIGKTYLATGNPRLASQFAHSGQKYFINQPLFSLDEKLYALWEIGPVEVTAAREQGFYSRSLKLNETIKKFTHFNDSLNIKNKPNFEAYCQANTADVFTYLAQQNRAQAVDSLTDFIDSVNILPASNEEFIYSTNGWTQLQYLTSIISAQKGVWKVDLIEEMVRDLLKNNSNSPIFYPAQLLAIKANWHQKKILRTEFLNNLLFYTYQQLKENFILLTAEERMNFYDGKLNDYFDLYHELLFSSALDGHAEIKEKIITQSLFLKNALADGNIIPDEYFLRDGQGLTIELIHEIRRLKQSVKLSYQAGELKNMGSTFDPQSDNLQNMWLKALDAPGLDSLTRFKSWQNISAALKPNQLYFETVRYAKILADSSFHYGAYVITNNNKIKLIELCSEKDLIELFNIENASPQLTSLKNNLSRGSELLGKKKNPAKKVNNTGKDLLADLLLQKLSGFLPQKTEWLMVHDGLLNRISFAALKLQNKFLMEQVQLVQWSGSAQLFNKHSAIATNNQALLVGGLQYGQSVFENHNRLYKKNITWPYLPGTLNEIKKLTPIFEAAGLQTKQFNGINFTDSITEELSNYSYIHLATHGFYLDSQQALVSFNPNLSKDALAREPLFRSGLAISNANNPSTKPSLHIPGHLLGYQIANLNLEKAYLITLSACETGLGDLRNNLGVDGLSRALKIAGAKHLLISLWKVPDAATAIFMQQFYTNLFTGILPRHALQKTQLGMSKTYPVSDWAAFVLVE